MSNLALAIHGGAGTILRSQMTPALESTYREALEQALVIGWEVLEKGGDALDAVERAVCSLEDFPLFNAGHGSVFTHEGKNEMDASIMDGRSGKAGAVGFVRNVKNPVKLARLVMERTDHIFLCGTGANQFATEMGVEMADDAYFFTEHRYEQLLRARERGSVELDHSGEEPQIVLETDDITSPAAAAAREPKGLGTVGAVACDAGGKLAAATSTGGLTNKKFGRVGDTPIIGAGTFANDSCAVSCTGHGEYFMLGVTAYDVAARIKYSGETLEAAAQMAIDHLTSINGEGGLIAVDAGGNVTMPFNSEGMYRGYVTAGDGIKTEIYGS